MITLCIVAVIKVRNGIIETMSSHVVRKADPADLDALVPLFDGYRVFYGRDSDPVGAREFLAKRFAGSESIIFIARENDVAVGFTQLFPSFSSAAMARTFILNDLFVLESFRNQGIGRQLLDAAIEFGKLDGAVRLTLSTAIDNHAAQALYRQSGWIQDEQFKVFHYSLVP